jgi:hypothetical protein
MLEVFLEGSSAGLPTILGLEDGPLRPSGMLSVWTVLAVDSWCLFGNVDHHPGGPYSYSGWRMGIMARTCAVGEAGSRSRVAFAVSSRRGDEPGCVFLAPVGARRGGRDRRFSISLRE